MSLKLDSPRDAFNMVKEKCSQMINDPTLAFKLVGIVLGVVAAVLWLSIILYKHRKARWELAKAQSSRKRKTYARRS